MLALFLEKLMVHSHTRVVAHGDEGILKMELWEQTAKKCRQQVAADEWKRLKAVRVVERSGAVK